MHILSIGLNHQTANVGLREKLAFSDESIKAALSRLSCGGFEIESVTEMAILSTCNRVEIYAVSPEISFSGLENFLSEARDIPVEELRGHIYRHADDSAVSHLFHVACGLGSLVLGEAQILGQVAHAFEIARSQNTAGPLLSRLFQAAVHAGKRARAETAIGQNPASVSSMAVRLAAQVVGDFSKAGIAVIGAGEMAELTVEALRKRGATQVQVVNRTLERAKTLADRWNGDAVTFEMLPQVLARADIVVSSTGAPHTIIATDLLKETLPLRDGRPLVMIDIAVPRDVDPNVCDLPGVTLYDIDSLQEHLQQSLASRQREIPQVERILAEEQEAFLIYLASLEVLPLIAQIREQAEALRQMELEKTFRRMPGLKDGERERIEAMTNALVKKILQAPLLRLRNEAGGPYAAHYATIARALFDLSEPGAENHQPGSHPL
ncbi:MAG: glutamyl-tRNA reductase [Chloroflexota bacterium]|nr:MAG: glutamyl-tRNA reductase [Chloroflexota bacterium]